MIRSALYLSSVDLYRFRITICASLQHLINIHSQKKSEEFIPTSVNMKKRSKVCCSLQGLKSVHFCRNTASDLLDHETRLFKITCALGVCRVCMYSAKVAMKPELLVRGLWGELGDGPWTSIFSVASWTRPMTALPIELHRLSCPSIARQSLCPIIQLQAHWLTSTFCE